MENKFNDYNNDNNVYRSMEGAQDNQAIDFQEQGMDKTDNNQRVYVTGSYGEAQPDFLNQPGMANQADLSQPETAGQTYARTQGQSDAAALAYPKTQEQSNADALAYARAQEQQNAVGQGCEAQTETVSQNGAEDRIPELYTGTKLCRWSTGTRLYRGNARKSARLCTRSAGKSGTRPCRRSAGKQGTGSWRI